MRWQTLFERFGACQRGTPCDANACGMTACFCHTMRTGAAKRVMSANIYLGELF